MRDAVLARPAPHALGSPAMLPMKAEAPYQHVLVQAQGVRPGDACDARHTGVERWGWANSSSTVLILVPATSKDRLRGPYFCAR
jgi:hypothetical protein